MAQHQDPVCGMMVEDTSAAATSDYQGKRQFFCSQHCKTRFDAHPEDFAGKS